MGQEEVYNILKKSKKPLTSTEISEAIDIGIRSVKHALNVLKKNSEIKFRRLTATEKQKKYGKAVNSFTIGVYYIKE